ncbi:MAG: hypothetical protein M3511_14670 [Deinococcota bacterium]|nr:hypothetical protein [Deinococcota bacterium]
MFGVGDGLRRFYIVATFTASGAWLSRRYRSRWLTESFLRVKHEFGLKEARLRTQEGMRLWFFFSCFAYSLAALERTLGEDSSAPRLTMGEAAQRVSDELLHDYRLLTLMTDCEKLSLGQKTTACAWRLHRCKA